MKKSVVSKIVRLSAVASLACLGIAGTAHAGWTDNYDEGGASAANRFTQFGDAGKGAQVDMSAYEPVNLGPLSSSLYAPKPGAQGPMRDADAGKMAKQYAELNASLQGIGGHDTP